MSRDYAAERAAEREKQLSDLAATRKALQEKLLTNAILTESPLVFQAEFDGYGDSGQSHCDTGNKEVDRFLADCIELFVTFDWYNGDGGGGDITWNVRTDKITINGYENVTSQEPVLEEAEF